MNYTKIIKKNLQRNMWFCKNDINPNIPIRYHMFVYRSALLFILQKVVNSKYYGQEIKTFKLYDKKV